MRRRTEQGGGGKNEHPRGDPPRSVALAAVIGQQQCTGNLANLSAAHDHAGRFARYLVELFDGRQHRNEVSVVDALEDGGEAEEGEEALLVGEAALEQGRQAPPADAAAEVEVGGDQVRVGVVEAQV